MNKQQAINIIKNLIDNALQTGTIKSLEQANVILQALQILNKDIQENKVSEES